MGLPRRAKDTLKTMLFRASHQIPLTFPTNPFSFLEIVPHHTNKKYKMASPRTYQKIARKSR